LAEAKHLQRDKIASGLKMLETNKNLQQDKVQYQVKVILQRNQLLLHVAVAQALPDRGRLQQDV
jgi:hypothetical protein